ncbi:hypothetical protein E1B28_013441 [Marasmius oreades]|uniref:Cytochrome P450 n=1 Tax=Marasmius oreades TaxID=181124 RepID=A0A9P7RR05_9AGAR|nr:uncharacterized protein E1B28_013441 [Marasmius oreades]KAG7087478.1 hypothetical protein E1B28_013441 [Marasmius oreades]
MKSGMYDILLYYKTMDNLKSFLILAVSSSLFGLFLVTRYRRTRSLPPGPKGLPILGNINGFQAEPGEPLWITFLNLSRIYGDIFTFHVLGSRTIVLNSYEAITELFERRSQNYSDRPDMPMFTDLMGWGWDFAFMRHTDWWRLHRRTFHQFFQPRVMPEYYDIQRARSASLIQSLLTSPANFFQHVRTHSGGVILEIVYGYQIQGDNDPYVQLADDAVAGMRESFIHGSFLVDYIPILKHVPTWFPGASFKTKAEVWSRDTDKLKELPWTRLKQSMAEGTAVPCFSTKHLENFKISPTSSESSDMEEVIKNCAAVSFAAGADTTVSAMLSFILAMVLNPRVQKRAQEELDEVIGSSRLPDFSDRENLPYINAILSETLRWKPVTPFSAPHRAVNDDIYEGYFIPGGSTIIPNTWAVLHNEHLYGPDTLSFNPDRFMKQDGKDLPPSPDIIAFGFGRRICPGRHLTINSIWLAMTYLLQSFTMVKEVDNEGKEIDPVIEYSDGLLSHPHPFNCRFISRSSALIK